MDIKVEIKKYWDLRGDSYDKSPGHSSLPDVWKEILSNVFKGYERILDVGTGTGFIALLLAELGHEVVGIDISEGMLNIARTKARKAGLDVEFEIGDTENLPFADCSFNAVVCRHLLWTLLNPWKAVKEWVRVVKPGGKIVVIDGRWNDNSIKERMKKFIGKIGIAIYERRNPWRFYNREITQALPLYNNLTPEKTVKLFESAGLSNISVKDLRWIRERINQPLFYRLAWGGKSYFMVEGYREVKA